MSAASHARHGILSALALVLGATTGCNEAGPSTAAVELEQGAYVWQRAWTSAVSESVASASPTLGELRVLMGEVDAAGEAPVWPEVDLEALRRAAQPITAVVRMDGSRPLEALSADELHERAEVWRRAGVNLVGIEIDHDCATAGLGDYADWLGARRPEGNLRWSITALPTWRRSPELLRLADSVDELVVQVHAVQAPTLFEPAQARRWLDEMSSALGGRSFRVALPTYRVDVKGERLESDPAVLRDFVRDLEAHPPAGLRGVLWFRLPVRGDAYSWSKATLDAVASGQPLEPRLTVERRAAGPGLYDLVLANEGTLDAPWPDLQLTGERAADLLLGYRQHEGRWTAPSGTLRAGEKIVVGWARGEEVTIDVL